MYTVSKGPSKIVAKTRRGITQNLERLENLRDSARKTVDTDQVEIISVQKPIFHMNGQKKSSISRSQQEAISPQHEEIIKFIYECITQNLERLENLRDSARKTVDTDQVEIISVQKPIFHMNGQKKSSISRSQQEAISPQHEEIIKFIYESWNSVCKECEKECDDEESKSSTNGNSHPSIVYYEESEPNTHLQDFTPFDLESWWGKRLFNTITKSIP
ncbi:hypothetical protein LSTR_LSTR005818 [Laodelphax striatellus]|uniref:Protein FAM195A n=1 Tax=Laodelphax striatellus TaxID=195883 RepID=A0A482WRX4_LAOST|nr:hypothetical protein LSTR_LSTR005818 [Laodelphax striatellus]